ncbi:MAG TPA: hypothetical protein VJ696_05285 [Rhodanobacteraceae bacterium]|nr:hypothetical protein [Rhodanobacteraceae bacterium]
MFAKRIFALLLACASAAALAQTAPPVDGIYWNPSQGGRGYAVETQDEIVFIAIYNYDEDNSSAFYFVQGNWDAINRRVAGAHLYTVESGPWIGSPFAAHGAVVDLGPVTFEFPTFTTGRFVFNGQSVNLQRFLYGYGPNADSLMRGIWHATTGDFGIYFGDVIEVEGPCTVPSCDAIPEAFQGTRFGGGNQRVLVGGRDDDGRVFFLLDSSDSYYSFYAFELRVNQWVGFEATFLKTDDIPDTGLAMFGARLTGPSADISAAAPEATLATLDRMRADASKQASPARIDGKAVGVDRVNAMLPALKQALSELK